MTRGTSARRGRRRGGSAGGAFLIDMFRRFVRMYSIVTPLEEQELHQIYGFGH